MSKLILPFKDYGNEDSSAAFYVASAISDANITAVVDAVDGVTLGNRQTAVFQEQTDKDAGTPGKSSNPLAQREIKYLVRARDNVNGKSVRAEIPTADLTLLVAGTDYIDITAGAGLALKTALDAQMLSVDGNAVTVESIGFVARDI